MVLIFCAFALILAVVVDALSNSNVVSMTSKNIEDKLNAVLALNPEGVRLFSPAFPLSVLSSISQEEVVQILRVKELTGLLDENLKPSPPSEFPIKFPWNIFPKIGIPDSNLVISKSEIVYSYEKHRHLGQFIWAYLLDKPRKGSLLVNHWKQEVYFLTEYDSDRGAKGFELNHRTLSRSSPSTELISWPPLALEIEIQQGKWQPVWASENILSGEILRQLPPDLPKATWELIFLLLISPQKDASVFQALLDTGLSPRQGLIAYLRLLNKVMERTEANEDTPPYRQIIEKEIIL